MPKLPRFKENVRLAASSPVQAFSTRTAGLSGKDQQNFAKGIASVGQATLKINRLKENQDKRIFTLDQEMELEKRMLNSFRDAKDLKTGADESGDNHVERFDVSAKKIREELGTISDREIKSTLLAKSTRLEARYGGKLRTGSLARRNVFNANKFEQTINTLAGSLAADPGDLVRSLSLAEVAASTYLGLKDQPQRQALIDKTNTRLVTAAINGVIEPGTKAAHAKGMEVLKSPFVSQLMDPVSMQKMRKEILRRDRKRVTDYIQDERNSEYLAGKKRRTAIQVATDTEVVKYTKLRTQAEKNFLMREIDTNPDYPVDVRENILKTLTNSNERESNLQVDIILRDLHYNGDVGKITLGIPENTGLTVLGRAKIRKEIVSFKMAEDKMQETDESKNAKAFIKAHFKKQAVTLADFRGGGGGSTLAASQALEIFRKEVVRGMSIEEAKYTAISTVGGASKLEVPFLEDFDQGDLGSLSHAYTQLNEQYKKLLDSGSTDTSLKRKYREALTMARRKKKAFKNDIERDKVFKIPKVKVK